MTAPLLRARVVATVSLLGRTFFALISLCACAAAQKASLIDVGVVSPRQVITGEMISATMVSNPRDFAGIATLQVTPAQLPGIPGVSAADLLKRYKVQAGDSTSYLPADGPFSFRATNDLQLKITRSDIENRA
jgi:hypothetical protein